MQIKGASASKVNDSSGIVYVLKALLIKGLILTFFKFTHLVKNVSFCSEAEDGVEPSTS